MDFIIRLSLEQRALVKIALTLWNRGDTRKWQKFEETVVEKASQLSLPKMLKDKLLGIIGAIELRIRLWMKFHLFGGFFVGMPPVLYLTEQGTIDSQRTLEVLVKDETIHLEQRFQLACMYCMEGDIRDLWGKLCLDRATCRVIPLSYPFLVSFWEDYLTKNDDFQLQKFADNFDDVVMSGNDIATRFFYLKMSPLNTENLIMKTATSVASLLQFKIIDFRSEQCSDCLCFLLSTMNAEQQAEIFQSYLYAVLKCLLVWPRQSLFLETAKSNWEFLSKQRYDDLLHDILDRIKCKHNYLSELFWNFWQQSPESYRQYVTDRGAIGGVLLKLYKLEEDKNFKLTLNDLSVSVKKKLIFGNGGRDLCNYFISCEKWNSAEYLIQECLSLPEEMIKFKEEFRKGVEFDRIYNSSRFKEHYDWDRFYQLVEDCILGCKKRKNVEENISSKKRTNIEE